MSNTIGSQNFSQAVQVAVARKQQDVLAMEGEAAIKLIDQSAQVASPKSAMQPPGLGSLIDIHM